MKHVTRISKSVPAVAETDISAEIKAFIEDPAAALQGYWDAIVAKIDGTE